jgi:hypothetical protein
LKTVGGESFNSALAMGTTKDAKASLDGLGLEYFEWTKTSFKFIVAGNGH